MGPRDISLRVIVIAYLATSDVQKVATAVKKCIKMLWKCLCPALHLAQLSPFSRTRGNTKRVSECGCMNIISL